MLARFLSSLLLLLVLTAGVCSASEWAIAVGGSDDDWAEAIQQTSDGGYVVAGYTESFGSGNRDAWILKLDASGDIQTCDAVTQTNANTTTTQAVTTDTNANITATSATPASTNAQSLTTDAQPLQVCYYEVQNQPPVANFTYFPENPTPNQNVTFNASSSYDPDGTITSYQWDFGDGSTASGMTVQHSYSSAGTYTVTLTVTDNNGLQASISKQLSVSAGETVPDNVDDTKEQIVSKYNPDFDWRTETPARQDVMQAVVNAVIQYFSTYDQAARQGIVSDVIQLVGLYFSLPA